MADLGAYVAMWSNRGERPALAERTAAGLAVEHIDSALKHLYALRAQLVTEIRQVDDETARRVDALLAQTRSERGGPDSNGAHLRWLRGHGDRARDLRRPDAPRLPE